MLKNEKEKESRIEDRVFIIIKKLLLVILSLMLIILICYISELELKDKTLYTTTKTRFVTWSLVITFGWM